MADRLYLLPVQHIIDERGDQRGPMYIAWRDDLTGLEKGIDYDARSHMYYGFSPYVLSLIRGITDAAHNSLAAHADVYVWPPLDALDVAIAPQDNLDTFFEGIGIPTDWLQPANTYLEFLRQMAAMFAFNQRYKGIAALATGSAHHSIITEAGGLNTRYNQWPAESRGWFDDTLASFGYPPVVGNPSLRQLMKRAGDAWGDAPFYLGGWEF